MKEKQIRVHQRLPTHQKNQIARIRPDTLRNHTAFSEYESLDVGDSIENCEDLEDGIAEEKRTHAKKLQQALDAIAGMDPEHCKKNQGLTQPKL